MRPLCQLTATIPAQGQLWHGQVKEGASKLPLSLWQGLKQLLLPRPTALPVLSHGHGVLRGSAGRTPLTDVLGPPGHHAPVQPHHLDGVHVDLDDVVDEGQQRGQGKGCHEDGGEAVLDR